MRMLSGATSNISPVSPISSPEVFRATPATYILYSYRYTSPYMKSSQSGGSADKIFIEIIKSIKIFDNIYLFFCINFSFNQSILYH